MSAFGGIHYFDGRLVNRNFLMRLGKGLKGYGPDGGDEVVSGSIGMTYRAFHTSSEALRETQPLVTLAGHILAWDGRLDNREELVPLLRHELDGDHTDVAIVMAAYLKWDTDFLARLVGDFALSLWTSRTRTLLLARDSIGPRPLYYHVNSEGIFWSSELLPLLELHTIKLTVNDEYVASYLTCRVEPGLTPYQGIYAVKPGTVVAVLGKQLKERRFWKLDPHYQIRYTSDGEYEAHFRHLFRESVRCRMRVNGPVWTSLSGGLDSSAIVCVADQILSDGDAQASNLETVSYVYEESSSSDERDFIRSIEDKRGRTGCHLSDRYYSPLATFPDEALHSFPDFFDCFVDLHKGMCDAMRAGGARVLLTGHGGDQMLCSTANPSPEFGDLLVQCQLFHLHRSLKAWSLALQKSYLSLLWHDGVIPLLPRSAQRICGLKSDFKSPYWLDEDFVSQMHLQERNLGPIDDLNFRLPSQRDQALGFLSAIRVVSKASNRARGFIEVSHPYLHRPLIEFLQAIPHEQRVRPGETRSLMRRALRDLLPEKILKRRGKKGPTEALFRGVEREWSRLGPIFENARVCSYGYMNAKELRKALERARHGCEVHSFAIIQTISLEFWLRALERRSLTVENAAVPETAPARSEGLLKAASRAVRQPISIRAHARQDTA